jgi:hypothetical protein
MTASIRSNIDKFSNKEFILHLLKVSPEVLYDSLYRMDRLNAETYEARESESEE